MLGSAKAMELGRANRNCRNPIQHERSDTSPSLGNQTKLRRLQAKLTIGSVNDPLEEEADVAADRVMRMADPRISLAVPPMISRKCVGSEEEEKKDPLQRKADAGSAGDAQGAPPIVGSVLASPGKALDPATQDFMSNRFGADFSGVRIHTDGQAPASAAAVGARAYTVGRDIVFGSGQYDPGGEAGRRLLAHELAHVVQQAGTGKRVVQRQATPDPSTAYYHIVVRDSGLNLGGGVLVADLAAAKTTLMRRQIDKPWTLVLAIHASEDRLGAQSPPDWQKDAIFYDAAAISALFGGDSAFVTWRDRFGPTSVVLYGCQVTARFEQTIDNNLIRGGQAPSAGGLGEGCKPLSDAATFLDDKDRTVTSRAQYDALSQGVKDDILKMAKEVNSKWGYYGGPPVPDAQVLDYLFKGPKPGWWPRVEVIVKQGDDYVSANPKIPYWNRLSNHQYLQLCTKAVGNLRQHTPVAP